MVAVVASNTWLAQQALDAIEYDWGDAPYNQDLSRRRASAVARLLVLSGCDPIGIVPKGHGETQPVAPNTSPANRQLNRRVEFSILSQSNYN